MPNEPRTNGPIFLKSDNISRAYFSSYMHFMCGFVMDAFRKHFEFLPILPGRRTLNVMPVPVLQFRNIFLIFKIRVKQPLMITHLRFFLYLQRESYVQEI